jgi:hypothetical protein
VKLAFISSVAARHPIPDGGIAIHFACRCQGRNMASIYAGSRGGEFGNEGRTRRFALRVGRRFAGREREKAISGVARTLFTCSSSKHLLFATGDKVAYETQYLTSRATEPIVFIIRGCVCSQA